jgi:hypothetical protein
MMTRKIKYLTLSLLAALSIGLCAAPSLVSATPTDFKGDACSGVNSLQDSTSTTCATNGGTAINNILTLVINIFSAIVGFTAVIMMIIAGMKFITANGDANAVSAARQTIIYASVGLVIVVFAQLLTHFILQRTSTAGLCTVGANAGKVQGSDPACK